jgi:membrane protein
VIPALWRALRGFIAHRGFFLAAGLSFYFLICLIPLLFLFISIAGFLLTSEAAGQAVLHQLGQIVPVYRKEMQEILGRIVATRRFSGLMGTVILVLFSTQLFAAQRLVLNEVFSVRRGRGYITGLLSDILMLFLMGTLFIGSIVVTDLFTWLKVLVLAPANMPRAGIRWMVVGIALAFNTVLFFVAYRYFPSRKVAVWATFWGALLASGLWEVAKQVFRWYILTLGVYDQLYGTLGALVALSMFAYYSGIVFILGAEYAAALDARWRARK